MTTNQLILLLIGHLCIFIHCLFKLQGLLEDARAANINFNAYKDYWRRDFVPIMASVCVVWLWYLVYPELAQKYPAYSWGVRCSFIIFGFVGSYGLQYALGKSKKLIRTQIDHKTNTLNEMMGNPADTKTDMPK